MGICLYMKFMLHKKALQYYAYRPLANCMHLSRDVVHSDYREQGRGTGLMSSNILCRNFCSHWSETGTSTRTTI